MTYLPIAIVLNVSALAFMYYKLFCWVQTSELQIRIRVQEHRILTTRVLTLEQSYKELEEYVRKNHARIESLELEVRKLKSTNPRREPASFTNSKGTGSEKRD